MIAMRDILKCRDMIAEKYNISKQDSARVVALFNVGKVDGVQISEPSQEKIMQILKNDFSSVPAAAAAVGVKISRGSDGKNSSHCEKKTEKRKASRAGSGVNTRTKKPSAGQQDDRETDGAAGDVIEKISGEVVPVGAVVPSLPASLPDDVENWLSDFSQRYDIDLVKASGQQWRSACIYIGQHIQKSGVLLDHERLRREGGSKIYNPEAVAALLGLWEYVTGIYKHVPLASDFIAFSGVSREWFYDSKGELTSSRIDIAQKARAIEESGLSAGLVDGRENPTGRIYYSKARLGWRESVEIVHTSNNKAAAAPALPVFDVSGCLISENVDKMPD